ncbi:hypothetical protein FJT64_012938 [Amphibalanus amphitrite]|uniref:Uncharacterized protein n=1 Tax=Amphibalanus amphitrite TaxID=1232801 RepID=A0A6A4V645_AMPAM|nr:hypothetical protein FJT64_012938 [Amphibalanus amphitrite]
MTPLMGLTIGAFVGLLAVHGGCADSSVFVTDQLQPTFQTLGPRQCLPADFDASETVPLASASAVRVTTGSLPAECAGVPLLALFYNSFAGSNGLLSPDASSFDVDGLMTVMASYSNDQTYNNAVAQIMDRCRQFAAPGLTGRQTAVYSYGCLKWSLFANCDRQQDERDALDEEGALRRARFLSGSCPLSPNTLKPILERVTGRTLEECGAGLYQGSDPYQLYEAGVARLACLLQDLSKSDGSIDFDKLRASITRGRPGAVHVLKMMNACGKGEGATRAGQFRAITVNEFAQCWASKGTFSCAFQEANKLAKEFPNDCVISAEAE